MALCHDIVLVPLRYCMRVDRLRTAGSRACTMSCMTLYTRRRPCLLQLIAELPGPDLGHAYRYYDIVIMTLYKAYNYM